MKIGFTSTSFRQIRNTDKIVGIAAQAGADIIEWGGDVHVKDVPSAVKVKYACDLAGIQISSYGSYYRVGISPKDQWRQICEIAAHMDCEAVRVWLGNKDSEKTSETEYKRIKEDTLRICDIASQYGLKVCPECHDNTFNNQTDAFLKLKNETDCENLRTYFQSRYKKKDYDLDRIARTLPHIESVHISYSEQTREQFPKSDKEYIDRILLQLLSCGFDGNLLLEYTYLFSHWGIPSMMCRDIEKIRAKVKKIK